MPPNTQLFIRIAHIPSVLWHCWFGDRNGKWGNPAGRKYSAPAMFMFMFMFEMMCLHWLQFLVHCVVSVIVPSWMQSSRMLSIHISSVGQLHGRVPCICPCCGESVCSFQVPFGRCVQSIPLVCVAEPLPVYYNKKVSYRKQIARQHSWWTV